MYNQITKSISFLTLAIAVSFSTCASASSPTKNEKLAAGEHFAPIPEVRLHYVVAGRGPLLFITSPGWGVASTYLQNGMKALEAHHKIIFIDTRGSGGSSQPEDPWQMSSANMAADIDQLRKYLGVDAIDLLGHSNGGAIAVSYAEHYQSHLRSLILVDCQVIGFAGKEATDQFVKDAKNDPRYKDAVSHLNDPEEKTDKEFLRNLENILPLYFHDPVKYIPIFGPQVGASLSIYAEHTQYPLDKLPAANEASTLGSITAKTLILEGKYDWICPPIVADYLHKGIKGSTLITFDESGHLPWIEEPTPFFQSVEKFLSE